MKQVLLQCCMIAVRIHGMFGSIARADFNELHGTSYNLIQLESTYFILSSLLLMDCFYKIF